MRKLFSFFVLFLLLSGAVRAAPFTRDLGRGLAYHRVHALPADLPTSESTRRQPCVFDLRYVQAEPAAIAALHAWIKFHASPRSPVFVLANASTTPALVAPLAGRRTGPSVLVVGVAAPGFDPDIAVASSPEHERLAYDALEQGAELASLLTDNPSKARNDEASLAHERPPESAASAPAAPAQPIDAALQRATHLHRALVALRKI